MQLTLLLFTQVLTSLRATAPLGAVTKGDAFPYVPEPATTVITGLHVPPGIAEEDLPVITDCDGSFDKSIVVLDLPIFFEQGTPRVFVDGYIGARHFDCVGFGAGTLGDMQLTLLLFTQVLTSLRATAPLGAVTKGDAFPYVPEPSTTVITGLHVPPGIAEEDLPVITDCDGSFDKSIVVLDLPVFFEQGTPRVFVDGYIGARHFDCVGFGAGTLGDMQLTLLLFTQVSPYSPICVPKSLFALPAPPTSGVAQGQYDVQGLVEDDVPAKNISERGQDLLPLTLYIKREMYADIENLVGGKYKKKKKKTEDRTSTASLGEHARLVEVGRAEGAEPGAGAPDKEDAIKKQLLALLVDNVPSGGVGLAPPACPAVVPAAGAPASVHVVRAGVDYARPVPAGDAAAPAADLVAGPPEAFPECVPVLAEVDDEVHLCHGVLVEKDKLFSVREARGDSMFVKEATKLIFGRENLHGRSVTGVPCRRFKGAVAKRALTPVKLAAMPSTSTYGGILERPLQGRGQLGNTVADLNIVPRYRFLKCTANLTKHFD
ncbi:uncharacterized protein ISCGN_016381 [Ixodes scapularis]